jgi:hypothetical protein
VKNYVNWPQYPHMYKGRANNKAFMLPQKPKKGTLKPLRNHFLGFQRYAALIYGDYSNCLYLKNRVTALSDFC